MNELSTQPIQGTFCFNCGRRANPAVDKCWYCSAPTRRLIRLPRPCPFCQEPIHPKAVKCPRCGEFVDGRKRGETPIATPQATYVIERAVFQPGHALPAPPPAAGPALPAPPPPSARALDRPQPRGLPAPEGAPPPAPPRPATRPAPPDDVSGFIDVSAAALPVPTAARRGAPPPSAGTPHVPTDNLPARRETGVARPTPPVPATRGGGMFLARREDAPPPPARQPIPFLSKLLKKAEPEAPVDVQTVDPESRFRICENCSTEILADDNFCYSCGVAQGRVSYPNMRVMRDNSSNTFIYVLFIACAAFAFVGGPLIRGWMPGLAGPLTLAAAAATPALAAWGFLRRPGIMSRLICFVFFLLGLVLVYVAFVP